MGIWYHFAILFEVLLILTPLLARASRSPSSALKAHPLFNSVYTSQGIAQRERVDTGIAVDIPEGLITPVQRNVATRALAALAEDWRIPRGKVKNRRLAPQDYRGATFYLMRSFRWERRLSCPLRPRATRAQCSR